jgi:hypothetical protein
VSSRSPATPPTCTRSATTCCSASARTPTTEGRRLGAQVSLFDVSDLSSPSASRRCPRRRGLAQRRRARPPAFLWWPATRTAVVPVQRVALGRGDADRGHPAGGRRADRRRRRGPRASSAASPTCTAGRRPPRTCAPTCTGTGASSGAVVVGDRLLTVSSRGVLASDLATMAPLGLHPARPLRGSQSPGLACPTRSRSTSPATAGPSRATRGCGSRRAEAPTPSSTSSRRGRGRHAERRPHPRHVTSRPAGSPCAASPRRTSSRSARLRLRAHRRRAAPLRRPGDGRSTSTRSSSRSTPTGCTPASTSRTSRRRSRSPCAPRSGWEVISNGRGRLRGRGATAGCGVRAHPAAVDLHHRAGRRPVPRRPRVASRRRRRGPARPVLPPSLASTSTPTRSSRSPARASTTSPSVSATPTRSASTTSCSSPSSTGARWRTPAASPSASPTSSARRSPTPPGSPARRRSSTSWPTCGSATSSRCAGGTTCG